MNLQSAYKKFKPEIKKRLAEFKQEKTDTELFYEACFCIMAVQTKGKNADHVARHLHEKKYYEKPFDITPLLKQHIRFHNNKTRYITSLHRDLPIVTAIIRDSILAEDKRELLVKCVSGFGMKEASHYLRNTGHTNLAILDRHILRTMQEHHVIKKIPSLTKKNYLRLEKKFREFAKQQHIPVDELDMTIWAMNVGEVLK